MPTRSTSARPTGSSNGTIVVPVSLLVSVLVIVPPSDHRAADGACSLAATSKPDERYSPSASFAFEASTPRYARS